MKKKLIITLGLASIFMFASVSMAIPTLQLDIPLGEYDPVSDGMIINKNVGPFDLLALFTTDDPSLITEFDVFLSVAVLPSLDEDMGGVYGSFVINGTTVDVTTDMTWGIPPEFTDPDLPPHDVFPTYYLETPAVFAVGDSVDPYNTNPEDPEQNAGPQFRTYFDTFNIDASGLMAATNIHFDLYYHYVNQGGQDKIEFAPPSHDAETVPEPGTLVLLGIGMLGVAVYRRKIM